MVFTWRMVPEVVQPFWAALQRGEFITTAAESDPGTPVHAAPSPTSEPSAPGSEDLITPAGAAAPDPLAQGLTLILDGGLADGVLDANPGHSPPKRWLAEPALGCMSRLRRTSRGRRSSVAPRMSSPEDLADSVDANAVSTWTTNDTGTWAIALPAQSRPPNRRHGFT